MRVDCTHCGKVINIPPQKVPDRAFAFACPACQGRITVEPASGSGGDAASADPPSGDDATILPVPSLKSHERQLMSSLAPLAYVVELGCSTDPALDADLEALGMQEILRFGDLESAVQSLLETEVGILVIAVPKAAAPPFEPLQPLATIPSRMRRRTFVVLTAGNVTSLDGQVAFFLQVNCLINSNEIGRRRSHLQRALLHHLKLYQHWTIDPT